MIIVPFKLEDFLHKALIDEPEFDVDLDERKEETLVRYAKLLGESRLDNKKSLSKLTPELLKLVGIPIWHISSIANCAAKGNTN